MSKRWAPFGGLDVVVDVIGEARWGNVLDFTDEDWEWSLATNLRQAFLVMQASGRQMVAQRTGGAMAVVSSVDSSPRRPTTLRTAPRRRVSSTW